MVRGTKAHAEAEVETFSEEKRRKNGKVRSVPVLAVLKTIAILGGRLGLNVRDSNLSIVVAPHGHFDGLRQNVGVAV